MRLNEVWNNSTNFEGTPLPILAQRELVYDEEHSKNKQEIKNLKTSDIFPMSSQFLVRLPGFPGVR